MDKSSPNLTKYNLKMKLHPKIRKQEKYMKTMGSVWFFTPYWFTPTFDPLIHKFTPKSDLPSNSQISIQNPIGNQDSK